MGNRGRMSSQKPAVFLDRDGVINHDSPDYVRAWSDFAFRTGSLEALSIMASWDIYLFIVTNQSAIARGYLSVSELEQIHALMLESIRGAAGRIDRIYYCPHHPDQGCFCRKPQTGLFLEAARDYTLDPDHLFMIGDSASDMEAGKRFGCFTIMLESPRFNAEMTRLIGTGPRPDAIAPDLLAALPFLEQRLSQCR
ncbi:HAD family hydrolase [bacterium]|nr:HAD family hydrolase [bacterium]